MHAQVQDRDVPLSMYGAEITKIFYKAKKPLAEFTQTMQYFRILKAICGVILEQSMGARNRAGVEYSYRSARLHRLAESIPWN
jgi:hypothetical protein